MLLGDLIHPQILHAIAAAGHGSLVLVADGNFPASTARPATADIVYLNLAPGLVTATDVLTVLVPLLPIERAELMCPGDGAPEPVAHAPIRALLTGPYPVECLDRDAFYTAVGSPDLVLVIVTGDTRPYANALLTIGVRPSTA